MTTVQQVYEVMQRLAPPELAEHWDNPGLLVDCGGDVRRVLVTLDITPEVVAEAAAKQCTVIVAHHPVIFDPLKRLCPADVPYQLVQAGISAICMHTNLDAAEGGVNDVLADLFGIRQRTAFADGCGRVGDIDPITVPELAALAQHKLAALCNAPDTGTAVQVKFADTGKPVRRLAVISGAGGSLFAEAIAEGADCLLTGEANHHHALDAKRLGLSLIAAGHYATEFPVTAAVAAALRAALLLIELAEDGVHLLGHRVHSSLDFIGVVALTHSLEISQLLFHRGLILGGQLIAVLLELLFHLIGQAVGVVEGFHLFLALLILFRILLCVFDSRVDIRFGEVRRSSDCDGLRFARCLIASLDGHDTVCVDVEGDFDLRNSARCGSDAHEFESAERLVVASKLSFTLQNVDVDCGLIVCRRAEHLRFACRNGGVSVDELRAYAAERFDTERQRSYVEKKNVLYFTR